MGRSVRSMIPRLFLVVQSGCSRLSSPWSALFPRTQQVLSRIQLGIEGVTEMDWLVNARAMTSREASVAVDERQWAKGGSLVCLTRRESLDAQGFATL